LDPIWVTRSKVRSRSNEGTGGIRRCWDHKIEILAEPVESAINLAEAGAPLNTSAPSSAQAKESRREEK